MFKKGLIIVAVFYLLGIFGISAGYFASNWDDEWHLGAQLLDAFQVGIARPFIGIERIVGT